uniref:Uncharacterized protein n=1 Tax=Rhizophora mucronata TaxID=61149 RepID=A0A2P2QZV8_RHIMU
MTRVQFSPIRIPIKKKILVPIC